MWGANKAGGWKSRDCCHCKIGRGRCRNIASKCRVHTQENWSRNSNSFRESSTQNLGLIGHKPRWWKLAEKNGGLQNLPWVSAASLQGEGWLWGKVEAVLWGFPATNPGLLPEEMVVTKTKMSQTSVGLLSMLVFSVEWWCMMVDDQELDKKWEVLAKSQVYENQRKKRKHAFCGAYDVFWVWWRSLIHR